MKQQLREVTHRVQRKGKCTWCFKPTTRTLTFRDLVHPDNTINGRPKTFLEVRNELLALAKRWHPTPAVFNHQECERKWEPAPPESTKSSL